MAGGEIKADMWIKEYLTPWDVYEHGITKIFVYKTTAYQEMYIVQTGVYGRALILDGKWQSCSGDEFLYHEALVQPAMICHQNPKNVLILGGGEGATLREVLRWHTVEKVVMVDIDGEVVAACQEYLEEMHQNSFNDPRVELIIGDAIEFLNNTPQKWDIVISDLTDPIDSGPSFQLFTQEYYSKIHQILTPEGLLTIQAGPVGPTDMELHASLIKTLATVFTDVISYSSYVPSYACPWGFAIASKHNISRQPNPEQTDALLAAKTKGSLRLVDGISLLGMFQTPAYIRRAIESATKIYTLKEPPKVAGEGVME